MSTFSVSNLSSWKEKAMSLPLRALTSAAVLPFCLALSACGGGGGGGVAVIPPPPPPPGPAAATVEVDTSWLTSPATKVGSYDVLGLVSRTLAGTSSVRTASPGEFKLDVSQPNQGFAYVLEAPLSFLPGNLTSIAVPVPTESWDFIVGGTNHRYENPYGDYPQFFGQNLKEYEVASNGSKTLREDYDYDHAVVENAIVVLPSGQRISESVLFDAGLSYVAMGEWTWGTVTVNSDGSSTPTGDRSSVYFAYGERTPGAAIPVSGSATYDAATLSGSLPFSLTADFGARSIATQISQASMFSVSGSAPFRNDGSFDIPLAGTAGSQAATGSMDGAFFGPHAEQVGGTFAVGPTGGSILVQDAFVGQQHPH